MLLGILKQSGECFAAVLMSTGVILIDVQIYYPKRGVSSNDRNPGWVRERRYGRPDLIIFLTVHRLF